MATTTAKTAEEIRKASIAAAQGTKTVYPTVANQDSTRSLYPTTTTDRLAGSGLAESGPPARIPGVPNPNSTPTTTTPETTTPTTTPTTTTPPATTPTTTTPEVITPPTVDYAAQIQAAIAAMQASSTQQSEATAAREAAAAAALQQEKEATAIRQAQAQASLKAAMDAQLAAQVGTFNSERAKIPGQTETANNAASATGMVNAQHIRNALNQMGLLQSGESATQQLTNNIGVASNINANNLAGQQLDASFADKIVAAQAQAAVDYNTAAYQYGRDAVADNQWLVTSGQAQQQINNQSSQFAQSLGLSQAQLAAQIAQNGAQNALAQAGLDQNASQFAAQLGLSTAQYYSGLAQWALNYNASVDQQEFENGIQVGNTTGNYPGDVSNGTDRVVVNPDGTISVVPVDATDPVEETPTTDVVDASGNITPDLEGTTKGKTGTEWKNYAIVGPGTNAPATNAGGYALTGYRLTYTSHGKKYYAPIYADQLPAGVVPAGSTKIGTRDDGVPQYKNV